MCSDILPISYPIKGSAVAYTDVEGAELRNIRPIGQLPRGAWPKIIYYDNGFCSDAFMPKERWVDGWPPLRRIGFPLAGFFARISFFDEAVKSTDKTVDEQWLTNES